MHSEICLCQLNPPCDSGDLAEMCFGQIEQGLFFVIQHGQEKAVLLVLVGRRDLPQRVLAMRGLHCHMVPSAALGKAA